MKKMLIVLGLALLLLVITLLVFGKVVVSELPDGSAVQENYASFTEVEYQTDLEFVQWLSPLFEGGTKCRYKLIRWGLGSVGPSQYRTCGFIVFEELAFTDTFTYDDYETKEPEFPEGIDPGIIGLNNSDWVFSKKLYEDVRGTKYMGDVLCDLQNCSVYFDLGNP